MTTIHLKQTGTLFGSRASAREIRENIQNLLAAGEKVTLDFTGVEAPSPSFIDELIAKLFVRFEQDFLREHLRLVNVLPEHQSMIRRLVVERQKAGRQAVPVAASTDSSN